MGTVFNRKLGLIAGGLCVAGSLLAVSVPWKVLAQNGRPNPTGEPATENERLYGYRGVIRGRVTFVDGKPAAGFRVVARFVLHATGAPGEGQAVTNADGRYEIRGLNPQAFSVRVENEGKPYVVPPPRRVDLKDQEDNIDFVLRRGPLITVRVRDAETGRPIPGMIVETGAHLFASPRPVGTTDKWGEFQFRVGQLEMVLRLRAADDRTLEVAPAPGYSFHHSVRLERVQPVTWEVRTYQNPHHLAPRTFTGTVVGPDGKPVAGALVRMIRNSDIERTMTDAAGRFTFRTHRMTEQEHKTSGVVLRADKGELSTVKFPKAYETWGTIVVRLEAIRSPSVYGVVTDLEKKPLEGVPITYWESYPGSSAQFTVQPSNGGTTDAKGRFMVSGLSPAASYHLRFGGTPQFHGGRRTFGITQYPERLEKAHKSIRLRAGEQRNIGRIVVPVANSIVAGRVVDQEGRPVSGKRVVDKEGRSGHILMILIRGRYTEAHAFPDTDGRFRAEQIVREPLSLNVYSSEDHGFRTGPDSPDFLCSIPVRAGDSDVQVVLPKPKTKK